MLRKMDLSNSFNGSLTLKGEGYFKRRGFGNIFIERKLKKF